MTLSFKTFSAKLTVTLLLVTSFILVNSFAVKAAPGGGESSNIFLLDTNANGKIDRITFSISNDDNNTWELNGTAPYALSAKNSGASDITISSILITGSASANPVSIQIDLNEADADLLVDTSASAVELIYTLQAGDAACINCIKDNSTQLNDIATGDANGAVDTENDGAAPVMITSTQTADTDDNGKIDLILVNFSEDLNGATVQDTDFTVTSPVYTITGASESSAGAVSLFLAESGSYDTGTEPTVTVGTGVTDTAGESTVSHSRVADDRAGPILVSASPTQSATHIPATSNITMTFSEPMEAFSNTLGDTDSITSSAGSMNLTTSGSTITADPQGNAFLVGTVTITLYGFNVSSRLTDANGEQFNYAGTVFGDEGTLVTTYSFTALNPSSSGGGASGESSTVVVTSDTVTVASPSGGETLVGGSSSTVTWNSTGNINNVNLSYSLDAGVTFVSIVSGTDNDGSYTWTVPNVSAASVLLRVVGRDAGGATLSTDLSNAGFSITLNQSAPQDQTPVGTSEVTMQTPSGASVTMTAGVLFRGASLPDVYRVNEDGTRYVFPNETTFFSWGYSFGSVVTVKDSELQKLTLGGRVTIKPGSYLVKIQTNPKVYQISEGAVLRHVPSEASASVLYGAGWATMVRDVPAVFFSDYTIGAPLAL